jgi:hypothetical protein
MRSLTFLFATLITSPVLAKSFDRPLPQAQTATAEFWFALASFALVAALVLVQRLVARR